MYRKRTNVLQLCVACGVACGLMSAVTRDALRAQAPLPALVDSNLRVRAVVTGLDQPTTMAFLGENDFLVLEKATGKVQRIVNGTTQTVLDLAVNSASERGLLGIAIHPSFPEVYLYWTESSTGSDTSTLSETALLGNRVDRFVWNGGNLVHDRNIIMIRALQEDATNPVARGNHDGGILRFGPDRKLYIAIGDLGRRGQMQNLPNGPFGPGIPDDQFGGPQPDDAHLSGVILRVNDDGTAPSDNPFHAAAASMPGEVGVNIQKVFAYGLRNTFGMDFDPASGDLWLEQNGDDSFTEIDRVEPGMNGGWVQVMGPLERIGQFKEIETSTQFFGLQQVRWSPVNIADSPAVALSRMFMLPGAHYSDPEFSWKFEVAPAGVGFLSSRALGPQYENDFFVGAARTTLRGGNIFRFNLTGNRRNVAVDDPRLQDRVADNLAKFDITESETLLFGTNFGVGTDIRTGPNGNLFVVSLSNGTVYEIFRRQRP